ncbi:MAG: LysR family transcriptional regulator [Nitratireductor sp.]|nr:LysR family transcriptional regulator [Nitratireductor sp.]
MQKRITDGVTFRALELIDELSRTGSMQEAGRNLGLSAPAASQQLKNLEASLGHDLVDHGRRPLVLNAAGQAYLKHVQIALQHLRQGAGEMALLNVQMVKSMRIGIIDDFDSEVTPRLAVAMANVLTPSELTLVTVTSIGIINDIASRKLDLGIAARPFDLQPGISEIPVLRDPFVLAVPRGYLAKAPGSLNELSGLSFLRYEKTQLLSRQISAHLARLRLSPKGWIEVDSNQAIFGLVASGVGWAITTPVGFLSTRRFHDRVDLFPLPFAAFARTISLFKTEDWLPEVADIIAERLRSILQQNMVEPGRAALPWIGDSLNILRS